MSLTVIPTESSLNFGALIDLECYKNNLNLGALIDLECYNKIWTHCNQIRIVICTYVGFLSSGAIFPNPGYIAVNRVTGIFSHKDRFSK
jgi:hypothetical protein